ncbi:mitochondrial transcription rescue factor 1 [Teleopsis dalmanni]|uniref:mitochondrial transcription rescue factor 1 n=1 Tax=Teleopsis dalmanni TaxID=139649 RepID=UPI0018CD4589|nr:mitochondrial transcription rescue factor 1 [Teleopsis dalmanni]
MLRTFRAYRLNRNLLSTQFRKATSTSIEPNQRLLCTNNIQGNYLQSLYRDFHLNFTNRKYNKKDIEDEDSDDEEDIEFKDDRDSKVVKAKVNSLRADLLLKAGLGMARNKIEQIFYDSKIRVNGTKLQKKGLQLGIGDEIDIIKGFSQSNASHIVISRVIILSAKNREEGFAVQLRRYKTLLIENYEGLNAYKSSQAANQ